MGAVWLRPPSTTDYEYPFFPRSHVYAAVEERKDKLLGNVPMLLRSHGPYGRTVSALGNIHDHDRVRGGRHENSLAGRHQGSKSKRQGIACCALSARRRGSEGFPDAPIVERGTVAFCANLQRSGVIRCSGIGQPNPQGALGHRQQGARSAARSALYSSTWRRSFARRSGLRGSLVG